GNKDPMRRARQAKEAIRAVSGLEVLVWSWVPDRLRAKELGFQLEVGDWVAVSSTRTRASTPGLVPQLEIEFEPNASG
ncbi:hypothetical protein ACC848_43950, partial [Rhizobium johnstonii]